MNKFQQLISDNTSNTLKRRAELVATQAEIAQQTIVNNLRNKISRLKLRMDKLVDLAPDSTDSLQVGSNNWDPVEWADKLQSIRWELKQTEEQLKIAENTYDEFFKEIEEPQA